jgi:hypothetical protein
MWDTSGSMMECLNGGHRRIKHNSLERKNLKSTLLDYSTLEMEL